MLKELLLSSPMVALTMDGVTLTCKTTSYLVVTVRYMEEKAPDLKLKSITLVAFHFDEVS